MPQISFHSFHRIYFISLQKNSFSTLTQNFDFSKSCSLVSFSKNFQHSSNSLPPLSSRVSCPLRPPSSNTLKHKLATTADALIDTHNLAFTIAPFTISHSRLRARIQNFFPQTLPLFTLAFCHDRQRNDNSPPLSANPTSLLFQSRLCFTLILDDLQFDC